MKKNLLLLLSITLLLTEGNAQNLWQTSGSIGIGTTSPSSGNILDVRGNTYFGGNVGIGAFTPLTNLHIQNLTSATINTTIRLSSFQSPSNFFTEISNNYNSVNAFQIKHNGHNILRSSQDAYEIIELGQENSLRLNFMTHSSGKITFPFGKVFIGTEPITNSVLLNEPANKVFVNGNIIAKKIRVTQTGWADYVFDENYSLMPLNKVAHFIKVHKHLPDVPSTTLVEKEGLDLGDIQAVLLRKIEELTLYVIAQQKQIDELKRAIK